MSSAGHNFLRALSSFWNRLFGDKELLQEVYAGTEETLGQAYFDLMEAVLGSSLNDTPIYHREKWRLLLVRQDQLVYNTMTGYFELLLPDGLADFAQIFNKVIAPDTSLEKTFDYEFRVVENAAGTAYDTYLAFYVNPFTSGVFGKAMGGVALNFVNLVTPTVHGTGIDGSIGTDPDVPSALEDEFATTTYTFTDLDVGRKVVIIDSDVEASYTITQVQSAQKVSVVDSNGNNPVWVPGSRAVSWRVETQAKTKQLGFWIHDALLDQQTLADNYGDLIKRFEVTTASYKSLIRGIFNYFLLGPALERVASVLNIVTDVPVAAADGELLKSYNLLYTPTQDLIVTDLDSYLVPTGSVRSDIVDSANWDVLTFNAFEVFTTIFVVNDHVSDPTWWHSITVPPQMLPDESFSRRTSSPELYEVTVNNPALDLRVGDVGFYVGYDDGLAENTSPNRPPLNHKMAYHAVDKFLKNHMFGVVVDPNYTLPRAQEDLLDIVDAGKPSYVYMYFVPTADFTDGATVDDSFTMLITLGGVGEGTFVDAMPRKQNILTVGSGIMIPSYFEYTAGGIVVTQGAVGDLTLGQTPVIIGGEDPLVIENGITDNVVDWPAHLTVS